MAASATDFFPGKPATVSPGHTAAPLKKRLITTQGKKAPTHRNRGSDSGGVGSARKRRSVDLRGPSSGRSQTAKKAPTISK